MKLKPGLHPRNKHKNGYDFDVLTQHNKNLISFVTKNDYGNLTIDFSDPKVTLSNCVSNPIAHQMRIKCCQPFIKVGAPKT